MTHSPLMASIDLGTNTCLLLVAKSSDDASSNRREQVLLDLSTVVRLGEGVDLNRCLQPGAMDRTLDCLNRYSKKIQEMGLLSQNVICVATSQARDASNASDFFKKVETQTGFRFQTLSGQDEARLTFLGALLPGMIPDQTAVVDIGGGSTEITSSQDGFSLDLGSVRFTERFYKQSLTEKRPVTDAEFWACQAEIDLCLDTQLTRAQAFASKTLVAVAGTATTLAAWHLDLAEFSAAAVDGAELTRGDVHRMVEELKWRTSEERATLPCMEPLRADVILAGAQILWRVLEKLSYPKCVVSTRGLRFGILQK